MLTDEQIELNKQRFKELLISTERTGISDLLDYLETTDFYTAPASTRYHGAYKGGLCEHCLWVYDLLFKQNEITNFGAKDDTLKICGLLHDLAKVNTYEYVKFAKKVNGQWYPGWKTIDLENRFIAGNHESTSCFIVRQFISLSIEEEVAISYHHGALGWDCVSKDAISDIYKKYPLTILLHVADLETAYLKC